MRFIQLICITSFLSVLISCKSGTVNLFKTASPHEIYQRKLITAGLDKTAMGSAWINSSVTSIQKPLEITIPYKETGYFAAEKIPVATYRFTAVQGQKLKISITKKPAESATIYVDVWQLTATGTSKLLASADTLGNNILLDIDETGKYIIRLQPELLRNAGYTLEITSGPSLGFPTKTGKNNIKSFWGDGRDENHRKHEGIDIFGTFRSPVIATNNGTVTRVNENNLGGKVIWFRPEGKDYTLYYAHLDEQIAREGQKVLAGDTLGLMGNTGNAKTTPTHLHFGIYTFAGAIDPLPFVNPEIKATSNVIAATSNLNSTLRTTTDVIFVSNTENNSRLPAGTILTINSATRNLYKAELPDGKIGFIKSSDVTGISKPIKKIKIAAQHLNVYDRPDSLAAVKLYLKEGERVSLLGNFGDYSLISNQNADIGWVKK
ncbi:MAG: M23 family metallopeptidase [Sphingobacteriales bacterium]|nr:MAG: M23 family metallopeptidase [Sphingobacteriales bacterium]